MPPRSRGTRGRGRAAPDFTARDVVLDELRKKEHHGSSRVRAALKRAKTFDEAKLRRRRRDDEGEGAGEEGRLDEAIVATKRVDIDALAKRCARACAMRVEKMLDAAFERDGDAAARGTGTGTARTRSRRSRRARSISGMDSIVETFFVKCVTTPRRWGGARRWRTSSARARTSPPSDGCFARARRGKRRMRSGNDCSPSWDG